MMELELRDLWHILELDGEPMEGTVTNISTDSRKIDNNTLYIPLIGERFDGHDFISSALEAGAVAALSQKGEGKRIIRVKNTLEALGKIASAYRDTIDPLVIGVTGSVGKTTTKDMTAAVFSTSYHTHKTGGNFNNEIGLPKTLLDLEPSHEAAIIEMGMSAKGEISRLTRIAKPDLALITNIGNAHIEYLGSREGIRDAKLEIAEGLSENGILLISGDEPLLWEKKEAYSQKVATFGIDNPLCDYVAEQVELLEDGSRFTLKGVPFVLHVAGKHNVINAVAAAAAGHLMGISLEKAAAALEAYQPGSAMRQNIYDFRGIKIMEDCYNAGPESMKAAMQVVAGTQVPGRKIAVLGTMRELGSHSPALHKEVGETAASVFDRVYLYGEGAPWYQEGVPEGVPTESHEELLSCLLDYVAEGDMILFKGSRLNYLEKVIEAFKEAKVEK
ncbi:MAG: UDP-N-acetylmuramoyl-tripeptide--D-alanyl-D-alanine ligase [Clostridia bacterium]|nr:UDP-N-acetylmuramoyl-tripeptide--D-alanyl-D-alanine ligase [Clostridia bacterium]